MGELVKEFEVFYEFFRKKCPYKDEVQVGLEFLMKKFADCSLIMYKAMRSKKDQEGHKLREEVEKLTSEMASREERHKHEKIAANDKNAILESQLEELARQNKELSTQLSQVEEDYERLKLEHEESQKNIN